MELQQPKITPIYLNQHEKSIYEISRDEAYRLDEEYEYVWFHEESGNWYKIVVPKGLIYDGASVPQWAWSISGISPDGLIRAAALIHDWLYIWRGILPKGSFFKSVNGEWVDLFGSKWSRKDADKLFSVIMRDAKMDALKRRRAYQGVRVGGWTAWYS